MTIGPIPTYTPDHYKMASQAERNALVQWLADLGIKHSDTCRIEWAQDGAAGGMARIHTLDRDPEGKIKIIVVGGIRIASTTLTHKALAEPPWWWPTGRIDG